MNYNRLNKLDKKTLINLFLMKDEKLKALEKRYSKFEILGKLIIDNKEYLIYRDEIK